MFEWQAIILTLNLALTTTVILVVISLPLSWWLANSQNYWVTFVESIVTLPLILPPTVLGYYLLVLLAPDSLLGGAAEVLLGSPLVFTFQGLVIGSVIYSLPFVVQPVRDGFQAIDPKLLEAAKSLGANRWQIWWRIILPLTAPMICTGAILGFAHTLGEFGVVLLIGGNIPGETRVISIALFDYVETLQMDKANALAALMLMFSFTILMVVNTLRARFNRQYQRH